MSSFITTAFPVFVGALIAFLFNLKLEKYKSRELDLGYLEYSIASLVALNGRLYLFKKQVVLARYSEALTIEEILTGTPPHNITIRQMANFMHNHENSLSISLEKLSFIARREPNLIVLLTTTVSTNETLFDIISHINTVIQNWPDSPNIADVDYLIGNTKMLYEHLDDTIYLVEKSIGLLTQYGHLEFSPDMRTKSVSFTDDSFNGLKPNPIQSWESGYTWFRKTSWYKRLSRKLI